MRPRLFNRGNSLRMQSPTDQIRLPHEILHHRRRCEPRSTARGAVSCVEVGRYVSRQPARFTEGAFEGIDQVGPTQ